MHLSMVIRYFNCKVRTRVFGYCYTHITANSRINQILCNNFTLVVHKNNFYISYCLRELNIHNIAVQICIYRLFSYSRTFNWILTSSF